MTLDNPDHEFDTAVKFDDGTIVWLKDGIIVDSNDMLSMEQTNELLKRDRCENCTNNSDSNNMRYCFLLDTYDMKYCSEFEEKKNES